MADETPLEKAVHAARSGNALNRESLSSFYLSMARANKGKPISAMQRGEDAKSAAISSAKELLDRKIKEFAEGMGGLEGEPLHVEMARLCFGLFLLDRAGELRTAALMRDDLGIYSVFASLRDSLPEIMGPGYYVGGNERIFEAYAVAEPMVKAASEMCGISTPPLKEIVSSYNERLIKEVRRHLD